MVSLSMVTLSYCVMVVFTGDVFSMLHILEHHTADWVLSARTQNYKLIVKWTPRKIAEREKFILPPNKKSHSERNNRKLRAFLAKKSDSNADWNSRSVH